MPKGEDNKQIQSRNFQLLKPQLAEIAEDEEELAFMGIVFVFATNATASNKEINIQKL